VFYMELGGGLRPPWAGSIAHHRAAAPSWPVSCAGWPAQAWG